MAIGKRTEGYAGSGHQSTTDASTVTVCTVEVPEHHHGVAQVTYICREKAAGGGASSAYIVNVYVYRDGVAASYGNALYDSSADAQSCAVVHVFAPTIDCTGTTLRVRGTGLAAHNLEHSAFVRWLALSEYTT